MYHNAATSSANGGTRYIANLYYNNRAERHMSSNTLDTLITKLHLMMSTMHSGWSGDIIDQHDRTIIHRCLYQEPE